MEAMKSIASRHCEDSGKLAREPLDFLYGIFSLVVGFSHI